MKWCGSLIPRKQTDPATANPARPAHARRALSFLTPMDTPLRELRARQAQQAAQRATHEKRRAKLLEVTASAWWSEAKPTRCLICHADVPLNYKPGQELACGH